jgi:branched-chain amino acid aminotransferase
LPEDPMPIIQAEHVMATDPRHARSPHAPRYSAGSACTQDTYRPIGEGMVPIQDAGFIHADAAYDVVSASRGYLFRMHDHLERFNASCAKFGLHNPYTDAQTVEILTNVVKLAGLRDAYIWWAVTRGQMENDDRSRPRYVNRFYAFVTPYSFILHDDTRTRGASLVISEQFERISPRAVDPTAKNFHWMDMKLSIFEALRAGADWSVLTDGKGNLTEAPGCNIFIVKDGVLRTPATGCLEGITRKAVFDLAEELGLPLEVTTVTAHELVDADEAFLTSTAGGVMPVARVNTRPLGGRNGPGELTARIHDMYWEKRWAGWMGESIDYATPVSANNIT